MPLPSGPRNAGLVTEFRKAGRDDVVVLSQLARLAYAAYRPRMQRAPAPVTADYAAAVRNSDVWVAEEDGRVLGMLVLVPESDVLLLENVAVRPDARGRGIGSELLVLAEREAARLGLAAIRLYTNEVMTETIMFYLRRGYEMTGRADQDGYNRVLFRKNVAGTGVADLVRRFYAQLWNKWDDAAVEDVLAEDFTFRGSLGIQTKGRDGWRGYRDTIRGGAPDFCNEIVELIADGDRAAARLSYTGHHKGPLAGIDPTGRRFEYAGTAFFTARSGKLASAWVLGDLESLRQQLQDKKPG